MKRISLCVMGSILLLLSVSAYAEVRCHEEVGQCVMRCDSNGQNCYNDCTTKQVCAEVSPPPQNPQPAGGISNGGAWGGVTIPINPK